MSRLASRFSSSYWGSKTCIIVSESDHLRDSKGDQGEGPGGKKEENYESLRRSVLSPSIGHRPRTSGE